MVNSIDYQQFTQTSIVKPEIFQSSKDISEINFQALEIDDDISRFRLQEAYEAFVLNMQSDIPFVVWLLENPDSAFALPGNIDLYGHDCIHLLLNRSKSNFDEAFVIGFTMGNNSEIKAYHFKIFRIFATRFYPSNYRFNQYHMKSFELGATYGESLAYKNINLVNFNLYQETSLETLRESLGISLEHLKNIRKIEKSWIQDVHN